MISSTIKMINIVIHDYKRRLRLLMHVKWLHYQHNTFDVLVPSFHMTLSKYDYANYDQFPSNFSMVCKTISRNSTKFEVIWTIGNGVMGQRSWRIFYCVIWGNGQVGILLPTNMPTVI